MTAQGDVEVERVQLVPSDPHPCTHVVDPGGRDEHCGHAPTVRFLNAWLCKAHALPGPPRPPAPLRSR
ncbi:hypothetical protein JOL79_06810 [Microbispora sp. RL4-1S]|uniref:Uncharacterized protein n=1 Tax=Microbispora oryzae TaxID=2806554 RepID=A0A940WF44_9ACTN|nr:hypothetical protein [Microbispora oryzae]MBP2703508.1 hypothetical protein [Microbispora oryzae]